MSPLCVALVTGTIRKAQNLLKQYSQHGLDGKKGGSNLIPLEGNHPVFLSSSLLLYHVSTPVAGQSLHPPPPPLRASGASLRGAGGRGVTEAPGAADPHWLAAFVVSAQSCLADGGSAPPPEASCPLPILSLSFLSPV